ncbi:hypothetical protein GCM10009554_69230 [Kribbella koreensis]|uniref:Uncharacterized protein n=1 Tax=Kribbella koreensis TaxID=57909 RepID=A0ABN1RIG0_9ACTN
MVMPARFTIRAAVTNFTIQLAQNCRTAGLESATWNGSTTGSTWPELLIFDSPGYTDKLTMYANLTPVGRTTWIGTSAYDHDFNDVTQTNATSYTKYGSSATIIGGRKGTKTALVATVGYYNPKLNQYVRWPNKPVTFQYQEKGSTVWKFLKSVTTSKTGQAAYTYYPNKTRTYRAYVPQNATLWDYYTVAISR